MKLGAFFAAVTPFLTGRTGHGEVARALYGTTDSIDAKRLEIYGRFCRAHRFEVVDWVYPECREAVGEAAEGGGWPALVEAYSRAHPATHFELNHNGAALPAFLGGYAPAAGLPAWLPELADFEWWEWHTRIAPGAPEDDTPDSGPLRLAGTVELRPYGYDLAGWLDADERAPEPEPEPSIVLFWRDRDLDSRRESARPIELAVLKHLHEGGDPARLRKGELAATVADLHEAGILLGRR